MSTGLQRNTLDKFYTKDEVIQNCIKMIQENLGLNKTNSIIEPSAGNGAWLKYLKRITIHVYAYDISPQGKGIKTQDYLKLDTSYMKGIHVIGNPPFGRQSCLAKKFIRKSCEYAQTVSFILPRSFRKESLKKTWDLYFHIIWEWDLPLNSFLIEGKEYDVPCVFQIWVRRDYKRKILQDLEPQGWEFIKKNRNPDFSIRRVGVNAGKISKQSEDKNEQSHYFIKTNTIDNEEFYKKVSVIKWEHNNTVGPRSISKQELIKNVSKSF